MASLAKYIFNQYFDSAGAVLNAGTIEAYAAGTVNLKDIYTTSTGDVTAANPFTLGSDGTGTFYLDGSYDLLLKDSAGNTLKTINVVSDNSGGSSQAVVNTLADLRALASGAYTKVTMLGSASVGDGGDAEFRWDADSTDADDSLITVQPSSSPATGRWKRLVGNLYVGYEHNDPTIIFKSADDASLWQLRNNSGTFDITASSGQYSIASRTSTELTLGDTCGSTVLTGTTIKIGDTTNHILSTAGDVSFVGTAGFYPRFLTQASEPAAGTGATQLDTSEFCVWKNSGDSVVSLCFNDGGTVKTVALA